MSSNYILVRSAVVFDKYSSVQEWLGGTWKFLFRQNASHNTFAATVGVYVGLENPHLLTPGWNYNLDIQFVLVSPEGELFDAHSTKCQYACDAYNISKNVLIFGINIYS